MVIFLIAPVVLATSILIATILEIRSNVALLLALYLFSISNIVITCTIAGLFHQLNNQSAYILIHFLFLIITLLCWQRHKKPAMQTPKQCFQSVGQFARQVFQSRELLVFFILVFISILFQLLLIYIMPPNTHDSMTTHLSRVGYWLQNNSYYPLNIHNQRDNFYPVNPAFQALWTIVSFGDDTFVELSQFAAMLICAISVYGVSRLLERSPKSAIFNALLFLSYPIVVMQGTTAQTDLVTAALISCAFYFLLFGFRRKQFKYLAISSLGIALALGSKQTAFFILPGYVLTFIFLWLKTHKEIPNKRILKFTVVACVFFLLFGSLTYIINISYYNGFFGPPGSAESQFGFSSFQDIFEILKNNSLRLTYSAIDPSGLTYPIKNYFIKAKARLVAGPLFVVGIDLESSAYVLTGHQFRYLSVPHLTEDEAWYGPVGFFLMAFALITATIQGLRKKDPAKSGLVLTFLIYALCILIFRPGWDPYQGRYFLSVVVLTTPLIHLSFSKKPIDKIVRIAIILLSISIIITTHLLNEGKPVAVFENNPSLIRETIWDMDRSARITIQNRSMRDPLRDIQLHLPQGSIVGLCINSGIWDYPFFGSNFSQTIVPIYPRNLFVDEEWIRAEHIDYIIFNVRETLYEDVPDFLTLIYEYDNWKLFEVNH